MVKEEVSDTIIGVKRKMNSRQENEELSDSELQMSQCREPEHFLLKVESFSESQMEKYESNTFQAGGYKWKLIFYPNGDKDRNGSNHISLYLSITDTQNLPTGWEVKANYSLFVYNSLICKYQVYKLASTARFNWLNTDSGFAQLMPLNVFKETSNGYLFGDACVFGAEIYVTGFNAPAERQTLSLKKKTDTNTNQIKGTFIWTVGNFSTVNLKRRQSEKFTIGDVQWNLVIYPKGNQSCEGKSISLYVKLADVELTKFAKNEQEVQADYKLRIRNQVNNNHVEKQAEVDLCNTKNDSGFNDFMPLSDVRDRSNGYLMNDSLIVEVEFTNVEIIET